MKSKAHQQNTLRIIGGHWRGRKLCFPQVEGLRPTPDRVRETLFNWLQGLTLEEDCLDLYAGSGACGLEALSRGARHVTFVDASAAATAAIKLHLTALQCAQAAVLTSSAQQYLKTAAALSAATGAKTSAANMAAAGAKTNADNTAVCSAVTGTEHGRFGLIFMDPPFAAGLLATDCLALERSGLLKAGAHVYLESGDPLPDQTSNLSDADAVQLFPANWLLRKQAKAGVVYYGLYQRDVVDHDEAATHAPELMQINPHGKTSNQ
jgi:16S rRNA (guanine966-N2)-methyltransferase